MSKVRRFVACIVFISWSHCIAEANSAMDILKKSEAAMQVEAYEASVTLTTKGGRARANEKAFVLWRKLQPDKIYYKMLTRFLKPPTIKNEGILFLGAAGDKSDVLLYLPNFKKTRRIENNNQGGSFMGSVFSYSDISPAHYTDFDSEKLKDEKCPGVNAECFVVKSVGKTLRIKHRSGYDYTKNWIRKDNFTIIQIQGYDKKNKLLKTISMGNYSVADKKNKKYLAKTITGLRAEDSAKTIFQISKLKLHNSISDSVFTRENLENP